MQQSQSENLQARRRRPRHDQIVAQAQSAAQRGRAEDSWIDISSQPSQSSLYSPRNNVYLTSRSSTRSTSATGSSQDEYEESESESDRILGSSTEELSRGNEEQDEDGDETATALGVSRQRVFTPQPNAFSHPPMSTNVQSAPALESYFPPPPPVTYSDRLPSNRMINERTVIQRQQSRHHLNGSRSTSDHDAALRASLTTLLSCAAAVRPKQDLVAPEAQQPTQARTFRLVHESEMETPVSKPLRRRRSRESSKERQAKKMKAIRAATTADDPVSPTMMTWMISAGVVLVFSAISFSAGYAWGKDAGILEGEYSCTSCGKEMVKVGGGSGLRKLRWASTAQSVRA